jgi:hypothetical protein
MEYFWSDGGNNDPYFSHRVKVPKCTADMYDWCTEFDDEGKYFRRWHVQWQANRPQRDYDVVQFEWREAANMFLLTWGGQYL